MKEPNDCKSCNSRKNSVFKCAAQGTLTSITAEKTNLHFKKKEMIFHDSDSAKGFYCIKSGSVRTYKISQTGKVQTFQIEDGGKWLGFRDLISGEIFNHDAICVTDTEVCYIRKDTVGRLMRTDGSFQIEVMKYLASEWKKSENQAYAFSATTMDSRLAELLLTLQKAAGNLDEFSILITREIMGSCIGITTEALIRALSEFKKRGLIEIEKEKIKILNKEALQFYIETNFQ